MIVIQVDDLVANHLKRALGDHFQWCRTNGFRPPSELTDLFEVLASGGQRRPKIAGSIDRADDALMRLALRYERVAEALDVSDRTVRRLVESRQLRTVLVGTLPRVRASDLTEYLNGLEPR